MIFTELKFFAFLAIVFTLYWSTKSNRWRKFLLLIASYGFYAAWDYRFLSLIVLSTVTDFLIGLKLGNDKTNKRSLWLFASLFLNLGVLAVFKYCNFFIESLNQTLTLAGIEGQLSALQIVLPVGISFYTFQTLSYTIDVYKGKIHPTKSFLDFSLFVSFFPQLVAGPIVRASDFLDQLDQKTTFSGVDFRWCFVLFLSGFVKKACVSDNLSPFVDAFYANPALYDFPSVCCCVLLYTIQIYCDFSGYSDMAIATAGLLGYRLRENFAFPYLAGNITEFWRRWHMSLSTWLRDYLYIPLGGNKGGHWAAKKNLMITMLLGGLWHGASWNFVLWGGLHGFALVVHKIFSEQTKDFKTTSFSRFIGWILTLAFVSIAWIPFRAQALCDTSWIISTLTGIASAGSNQISKSPWTLWSIVVALLVLHWVSSRDLLAKWWQNPHWLTFTSGYAIAWSLALFFRSMSDTPFIYFQF